MKATKYQYKTFRVVLLDMAKNEILVEIEARFSIRFYSCYPGRPNMIIAPVKTVIFPPFTKNYETDTLTVGVIDDKGQVIIVKDVDHPLHPGDTMRFKGIIGKKFVQLEKYEKGVSL